MNDIDNPLLLIVDWLGSQAQEIREHLCFQVRLFEGEDVLEDGGDIAGTLLQRLRDSPRGFVDVGKVFELRAILDFELTRRAKPSDFTVHRMLMNKPNASPAIREGMARTIREAPLRDMRWRRVHQEWCALRAKSLTDENIEVFMRDGLRP